jgi:acetyl esterase/lipase
MHIVMAGRAADAPAARVVPAIPVFLLCVQFEDVDARHKAGHGDSQAGDVRDMPMIERAELVRFALRLFVRQRVDPRTKIANVRRRLRLVGRLAPRAPRRFETIALDAGGVPAELIIGPVSRPDRHVLYCHGGGYVLGWPSLYRDLTWRVANAALANVLCIDYRLAPEHPFPAAVDDAVTAYRWLLAEGADPRQVAIAGDSAGGGLALATLLRLRDEGVPLPAAAAMVSPWTDLALTGTSFRQNVARDPMIPFDAVARAAEFYLAGADARHPYASPLYADPAGLPPTLILAGGDEILRDDALRMVEKMRAAGCEVEFEVAPRMFHGWHLFSRLMPESRTAIARIGTFLRSRMD